MVAQSQDPSRIQNYRNEHAVSSKNPEKLVPLETITIEVVSDTPLAPPITPLVGATGCLVSVPKLATQQGLEVDTGYASTEFEVTTGNDSSDSSKAASRSNSDSKTESTEGEDFREGNYLDQGCRPSRFAKAKEGVDVTVAVQLIDEERRRQRILSKESKRE